MAVKISKTSSAISTGYGYPPRVHPEFYFGGPYGNPRKIFGTQGGGYVRDLINDPDIIIPDIDYIGMAPKKKRSRGGAFDLKNDLKQLTDEQKKKRIWPNGRILPGYRLNPRLTIPTAKNPHVINPFQYHIVGGDYENENESDNDYDLSGLFGNDNENYNDIKPISNNPSNRNNQNSGNYVDIFNDFGRNVGDSFEKINEAFKNNIQNMGQKAVDDLTKNIMDIVSDPEKLMNAGKKGVGLLTKAFNFVKDKFQKKQASPNAMQSMVQNLRTLKNNDLEQYIKVYYGLVKNEYDKLFGSKKSKIVNLDSYLDNFS